MGTADSPLRSVPMAAHGHQIEARHQTVLPAEPEAARLALEAALAGAAEGAGQLERLREVCRAHPGFLDGWAHLGQVAYLNGDPVAAYAYSRVGYHRGLDRLRRHGWGGTGQVRWSEPSNRGFLRSLHLLMAASAAIGEEEEYLRCRQFLLDLDPADGLGVAGLPQLGAGEVVDRRLLP